MLMATASADSSRESSYCCCENVGWELCAGLSSAAKGSIQGVEAGYHVCFVSLKNFLLGVF